MSVDEHEAHPDGARWRRKGLVWAWPITESIEWVTPRGDHLFGSVGDWYVVSEDGSMRTVSDSAFTQSYTHIEKQVYRRTGEIRARQVFVRTPVPTLEGSAHAEPGDWVATDALGNRWPIPAEVFATLYGR